MYQYESKGRPKKGESPKAILYRVACTLLQDDAQITKAKLAKGRFVLATNQLCEKTLIFRTKNYNQLIYKYLLFFAQ